MNLHDFLNTIHPISESDFMKLENLFKFKSFKKGEIITAEGQVQKHLYFVRSGVQMSFLNTNLKKQVIAFTYAPNLCAIPESFFFQQPSKYNLVSLSKSEMDYIVFNDLQRLFNESQEIERLFRKLTEVILAGTISKLIELQTLSIEERFVLFCRRSPHLLNLVPHKYISSYLGINETNFSKLFNSVKF